MVIRPFGGFFTATVPPLSPADRLSIFGGGFEGSAVLAGRVGERVHTNGTATPGEMTLLVLNAVGSEMVHPPNAVGEAPEQPDTVLRGRRARASWRSGPVRAINMSGSAGSRRS